MKFSLFGEAEKAKVISDVSKWFPAIHSLIVGPGLGRDHLISKYLGELLSKFQKKPVIFDADSFWYMTAEKPEIEENSDKLLLDYIRKNFESCILTPNEAEFTRLWKKFLPGNNMAFFHYA